jgi:hypothetical protein
VAILVSVGFHAAIFSWRFRRDPEVVVPVAPDAASPPVAVAIELGVPVDVVLFEYRPPETAGVRGDAPTAPVRPTRSRRAGVAGATVSIESGPAGGREVRGPDPEATTGRPRPGPGPAGMSSQMIDDFLARSKPLPPAPDIPGERIADEIADARRRVRDARGNPDKAMLERIKLVQLYDRRDAEELRPAGGGTYESDQGAYTAHVAADGSVALDDKPNLRIKGLGATFDVTDWAMRSHGDDPYAAQKLAFLDRTRDQRVEIGKRHRKQQLARSAELARNNVDRLLATTTDLAARKVGLFELWDECAEPDEAGADDLDLVTGGAAARDLILGVIRAQLRGDHAYTTDELAAFNRRRQSKARFAPYD